ncbi:hypothetical protein GCM10029963_03150 [Micromonospora andamanensis]
MRCSCTPHRSGDREYFHLFFTVGRWIGEPFIAEPDKCGELCWATSSALPPDLADYVAEALAATARGENLLLRGW